jgi:hypothetical protein
VKTAGMFLVLALLLAEDTPAATRLNPQSAPAPGSGRRGQSPLDPMFTRADEALALFYRLVDGLGRLSVPEVDELTQTATVIRQGDDPRVELQTIRFLSHHHGVTLRFSRPDRILTSVDLLVNWSLDDLRNTFGDKFKRRLVAGETVLDYGRHESGRSIIAFPDRYGTIRTVRFASFVAAGR